MTENARTVESLEGGCLCGAVRYRVRTANREGYYCHCRMCQLAFGGLFAPWLNVRKDELEWLGSAPRRYASSRFAHRGFCPTCGTPLTFAFDDSENLDLSVGSLDDPGAVRPASHFAIETRVAAWHVPDGLPESRADQYEALMRRWREAYGEDVTPGIAAVREGGG